MPVWIGSGSTNNWSEAANWGTDGVATGVPTSTTDAIFSASSKNVTITAGATCRNLNFSTYTGQVNMANQLTFTTNLTFSTGMTVTGTQALNKTGNGGLITSNGYFWPNSMVMPSGGGFLTNFGDNLTIGGGFFGTAGLTTLSASTSRVITVGGNLASSAGFTCTNIGFVMNGSGTLSGTYNGTSITINTLSSNTITQGSLTLASTNFNYSSGTYNSTAAITIGGTNNTFSNVSGITFSGISFAAALGQTLTLNSDMYVSGGLSAPTVAGTINNNTIYVGGNITPTQTIQGTSNIEMIGSSNSSIAAGTINNNLNINKSSGATVTLGSFTYGINGRTFQLTSGIINPGTSTITIPNSTSVTLNNLTLWNLTVNGVGTITQNVRNTIQNNLTLAANGNVTFSGTAGWDCANLLCSTVGRTITLQEGVTFNTSSNANMVGSDLSRITMASSSPSNRAIWTLAPAANQSIIYVNGTRIDSSLGQTIWSFGGTLNNTLNWNLGSRPQTVAYTFIG